MALFQCGVLEVTAYRDFLRTHCVNFSDTYTHQAYSKHPFMSKANYTQAYPLPERCFSSNLKGVDRVAVSSDSKSN